jgi:photosystem II stability/assembly factor-like uncharacterized protein
MWGKRLVACLVRVSGILAVGACEPTTPTIRVGESISVSDSLPQRPPVEAFLAINPNDPVHLLGAAMTSTIATDPQEMLSGLVCSSFLSRDDGSTWDIHEFPVTRCFDPWITILPNGHAVFSAFAGRGSALIVFTSQDGGATWADEPDTLGSRHDHPSSAVDRTSTDRQGHLYILSSQLVDGGAEERMRVLFVARSLDSGMTFEVPIHLQPSQLDHYGEIAAVLSDGTLVISYTESDSAGSYLSRRRAWVLRSTDGGKTFSDPELVNDACGPPYRLSWLAADLSDGPFQNRIYFACNLAGPNGVVVNHSPTGGGAWSDVVQVHVAPVDSAVQRKAMALAVNKDGVVGIAWVDGRHAPPDEECYDIYFSASLDGGESFLPEQRVTESTSCPDEATNGLIGRIFASSGGDYIGMATDAGGRFRLLWSDARGGSFHLRTNSIAVEGRVGPPH